MLSDRGYSAIIYLVAIVWGVNMIVSIIPGSGYKPDPAVHGIFTTIVGGSFVLRAKAESRQERERTGGDHRR